MTGLARAPRPWTLVVGLLLALAAGLPLGAAPALAATGAHSGAHAAAPNTGVTVSLAEAGYEFGGGSNYRLNGPSALRPGDVWVPLHVVLSNSGGGDATARVAASIQSAQGNFGNSGPSYVTQYALDVALGPGAHKAVTLYLRAADLSAQAVLSVSANGHQVASSPLAPNQQPGGVLSVGVLSDDTGPRTLLRAIGKFGDTNLSVAQFSPVTPLDVRPEALDNFDLIILTNTPSDQLSAAQLDALRSWVRGGGTLLVAGGADAQKTMAHLPADLLAASYSTTTVASSLPELASVAGGVVPPSSGAIELSVARPLPGARVLAAHNGIPLAVDRPLGRGHLAYLALEPTAAPFNSWPTATEGALLTNLLTPLLWGPLDALIADDAQNNPVFSGSNPSGNLINDLSAAPTRGLPALQVYVLLIVLYILVLGPGNYVVLRWRKRLEWSWVSVPVLAALFGLGSFGLAYARNGGDALTNIDAVIYLDPGSTSRVDDSYIGLFAPFRGDYGLSAPSDALAWGLGGDNGVYNGNAQSLGMRVDEGTRLQTRLFGLQMWSLRTVGMHEHVTIPGQVSAHLTLNGAMVSGTVTNGTNLALHDCAIVGANGASAVIPLLAPGQTLRLRPFSLSSVSSSNTTGTGTGPLSSLYGALVGGETGSGFQAAGAAPFAPASRYNTILTSLFPSGSLATVGAPLALIGWSDAHLSQLTINGAAPRRSDLNLIVAPLSLEIAPGHFALSPGDLPVSVVGTTVQPSAGSSGGGLQLNASDHVDVQLALPTDGRRVRLDTVTLLANITSGSSTLSPSDAQLWNWVSRRWNIEDLSTGTLTLHHAWQYAGPDGRILLRVTASQGGDSFANVEQNLQIGATGTLS